jgi:hypothetical protein
MTAAYSTRRRLRRTGTIAVLLLFGCASVFLQTDDFPKKLEGGCSSEEECHQLVREARARVERCQPNTIGAIKCSDAHADLEIAEGLLAEKVRRREEVEERNAAAEHRLAMKRQERALHKADAEQRQQQQKEEERRLAEETESEAAARAELEERQRADQHRAELKAKAGEKEYAVVIASAYVCRLQEELQEFRRELRREGQIETTGGVVSLGTRRQLAENIQQNQELIQERRDALRNQHGASTLGCSAVRRVLDCEEATSCNWSDRATGMCVLSEKCHESARRYVEVWLAESNTGISAGPGVRP